MVQSVTIKSVGATTVTFAARSASRTGDPRESLLREFTVALSDVWTQPIAGAPAPVAMVPGASGPLYLSRNGWMTMADGFRLFGADQAVFKWPDCAATPTPPITQLGVVPSSIVIHGHVKDEAAFFELELLGPDAAQAQELRWTGAHFVDVQLTEAGARRLGMASCSAPAQVWPTRIVVKGAPECDRAVSGEVDVLDSELAEAVQHIAFGTTGAPVTLSLTQDGVNAFHVTPEAVAELLREGEAEGKGEREPRPEQRTDRKRIA